MARMVRMAWVAVAALLARRGVRGGCSEMMLRI
jgi:hypothetical protein